MIVREIIKDAVLNLNLNSRDPRIIERAVSLFGSVMRRYSGNNTMTAYQNTLDFVPASEKVTVGAYRLKDGYNDLGAFASEKDIGPADSFVDGVDVAFVTWYYNGKGAFVTPGEVYVSEDEGFQHGWAFANKSDVVEFMPDFVRMDVSDCVNVIVKDGGNYKSLAKVPYAQFYTDGRQNGYSYRPIGENKLELLVKPAIVGRECKLIYTTSMKFDENSVVELPELYQPLILTALTVDLGNAFPAVDPTIVNRYETLLTKIENDVSSKNVDERMVIKEDNGVTFDPMRVDMFIGG